MFLKEKWRMRRLNEMRLTDCQFGTVTLWNIFCYCNFFVFLRRAWDSFLQLWFFKYSSFITYYYYFFIFIYLFIKPTPNPFITFEDWANVLPDGNAAAPMELTQSQLHVEEWNSSEHCHQQVGQQKSTWARHSGGNMYGNQWQKIKV